MVINKQSGKLVTRNQYLQQRVLNVFKSNLKLHLEARLS